MIVGAQRHDAGSNRGDLDDDRRVRMTVGRVTAYSKNCKSSNSTFYTCACFLQIERLCIMVNRSAAVGNRRFLPADRV